MAVQEVLVALNEAEIGRLDFSFIVDLR